VSVRLICGTFEVVCVRALGLVRGGAPSVEGRRCGLARLLGLRGDEARGGGGRARQGSKEGAPGEAVRRCDSAGCPSAGTGRPPGVWIHLQERPQGHHVRSGHAVAHAERKLPSGEGLFGINRQDAEPWAVLRSKSDEVALRLQHWGM